MIVEIIGVTGFVIAFVLAGAATLALGRALESSRMSPAMSVNSGLIGVALVLLMLAITLTGIDLISGLSVTYVVGVPVIVMTGVALLLIGVAFVRWNLANMPRKTKRSGVRKDGALP